MVTKNLHFRLEFVLQDTIKLLYIMLHERVERFPSKRLCELVCPCWAVNGRLISSGKGAYQQVDQMFAIHRKLVVRRGLHFLMRCRFLLVFGTQPLGDSVIKS